MKRAAKLLCCVVIAEILLLPNLMPSRNKCLKAHMVQDDGIVFVGNMVVPTSGSHAACDLYIRVDENGEEIMGTTFAPDGTTVSAMLR